MTTLKDREDTLSLAHDRETNRFNPCVGHVLLTENERVRVWDIHLQPGERIGFHRHVLDYFWVCHSDGKAVSNHEDGTVVEASYSPGDIVHHVYKAGQYKLHDLANVGTTPLHFTTVEFLASDNEPLPLPADVPRLSQAAASATEKSV